MDIFNTKKIEELNKTVTTLCDKVAKLSSDNVTLKNIAFEQFKKDNKPKFKIGDKVKYTHCGLSSYTIIGIVFKIEPSINYYGKLAYQYSVADSYSNFDFFEEYLVKEKR